MGTPISINTRMSDSKKAVLLFSSYGGNLAQEKHTNKVNDWCEIKKLDVEKVDGADPDSRDTRNTLWEVSGARGYPQMFIRGEDGRVHAPVVDYLELDTFRTFPDLVQGLDQD